MARRLAACILLTVFLALPLPADKSQWVEVTSPNFVVISNGGQTTAQRVAVQFEQIRVIFRKALPYANAHESPVITVIAAKDEKSLRELLPEYWEKGHSHIAGIFFFRMNKYYVVLRSDLEGPYAYEPIYHEYFHSVSLPYMPGLPLWLAEGFADFYGNTAMAGKEALLGRPNEGLLEELRSGRLIPLEVLFQVDHSSPYYNEQNKTSVFYAESWALVHYLMLGDKASHRQLLNDYLTAFTKGADAVEAGRKAFGDLGQFQKQLGAYISRFAFYEMRMPQAPEISEKHFPERPLSAAESDAIRGDFEAYRGKKDLAGPLIEEAKKEDPKLALPHESLGILAYTSGQHLEALHELNKAVELDPQNFRTLFFRSYLAFYAHGEGSRNEQVETDLRRSIALNPNFPAAYGLLASYLAAKNDKLEEALGFAKKAVELEPGTSSFQINLGEVLMRLHRDPEAITAGLRADRVARGPGEHAAAQSFLTYARRMADYEAGHAGADAVFHVQAPDKTAPAAGQRAQSDDGVESDANEPRPMEAQNPAGPTAREPDSQKDAPKLDADRDAFSAKGRISKVSCAGRQITVSLDFGSSRLQLQNADFGKIGMAPSDSVRSGFDLCTQLQGRQATITYLRSDNAQSDGTILKIELVE
jgi:tetratricopeptide (TPR) repeat protein